MSAQNYKTQLGITKSAWQTLEEDARRFGSIKKPITRNKLCSTIVINAIKAKMSVTNVDTYIDSFWVKYQTITRRVPPKELEDTVNKAFEALAIEEYDQLSPEKTDPKDKAKQFNLSLDANLALVSLVDRSKIQSLYKRGTNTQYSYSGRYVNLILETYAHLPYAERVRIFCYGTYSEIKKKIAEEKSIWIQHRNGDWFEFIPSKIVTDTLGVYLYAVGQVNSHYDRNSHLITNEPYKCSFRLERISIKSGLDEHIKKLNDTQKDEIQGAVHTKKVAYLLSGELVKATFRLTKIGVDRLESILSNRPDNIEAVDNQEGYYTCTSTPIELFNYLTRLGPEAEVIEPLELREHIRHYFKRCCDVYQNEADKAE